VIELVGGEDVSILSSLAYVNNLCFGIEGDSGSGKTLIMDKWESLLDPDEYVLISQATGRSLHNMADEINTKRWIYFSEIQKIATSSGNGKSIIELLKDLAEGKPSTLSYTISRGKTGTVVIEPKNIAFTRAKCNSFELDRELRRRFLVFDTESDIEHTNKVNEKALANWSRIDFNQNGRDVRNQQLKDHLYFVASLDDLRFIDPFAFAFGERIEGLPKTTCFLPQYGNILRASAKYHYNDRMKFNYDGTTFVVLDIEDHYQVSELYHQHFLSTVSQWNGGLDIENKPVDWSQYFAKGVEEMKTGENLELLRQNDPKFSEKWLKRQLQGSEIHVVEYKTGDTIQIGDFSG